MITVIMPSFFSSKLVKERIREIDSNTPIIIIENSRDQNLKKELEMKFSNVEVIIPEENLGWGKAINLGIKYSKTNMVFITQPDVKLIDDCINKLKECTKVFSEFSILTPVDLNNKTFKNYEIYNSYDFKDKYSDYSIKEVDYVDLTWLINKSKFYENEIWDEKIFLYFEAKDFSKRVKDNHGRIFITERINTYHIGSSSHDLKYDYYSKLNRNWHYNWSRHYYNKKHKGLFFAYRKSISLLTKLLIKLVISLFSLNFSKSKLIVTEINGLVSSMLGFSSYYRPYKKIN